MRKIKGEIKTEKQGINNKDKLLSNAENVYFRELIKKFRYYQKITNQKKYPCKKLLFNWSGFLQEHIEMIESSNIYRWLYPIKFDSVLAVILEEIQWNINNVLKNREKAFKNIYSKLHITKEYFYKELEDIQKLLIESNKVKVCDREMIIIMNKM